MNCCISEHLFINATGQYCSTVHFSGVAESVELVEYCGTKLMELLDSLPLVLPLDDLVMCYLSLHQLCPFHPPPLPPRKRKKETKNQVKEKKKPNKKQNKTEQTHALEVEHLCTCRHTNGHAGTCMCTHAHIYT